MSNVANLPTKEPKRFRVNDSAIWKLPIREVYKCYDRVVVRVIEPGVQRCKVRTHIYLNGSNEFYALTKNLSHL